MSIIRPGRRRTCLSAMGSRSATRCTLPECRARNRSDIEAETRSALAAIKKVLDAAGFKPSDVVQVTVYLKDVNEFPEDERRLSANSSPIPSRRARRSRSRAWPTMPTSKSRR